MAPCLQWLVCQ